MEEKKTNKGMMAILGVCVVFFLILISFSAYTINLFKHKSSFFKDSTSSSGYVSKKAAPIGVIKVSGVIIDSKKTIELLHMAEKDKSVKAIILQINSPGGAVGPTQEIFEEIRRIDSRSEKEGGKPIYASFESVAASGGYYLGAATRKIYSNAGAITGSIGVIMNSMDLTELFDYMKVRPRVFKAGKYKDIGSTSRKMTQEEKDIMNEMISGVHTQFKEDILIMRKDKLKKDIDELAQGQIFSGESALDVGLVDAIGGLWKAAREIHLDLELKEEFAIKYIKKDKKPSLMKILGDLNEVISSFKPEAFIEKVYSSHPVLMYR